MPRVSRGAAPGSVPEPRVDGRKPHEDRLDRLDGRAGGEDPFARNAPRSFAPTAISAIDLDQALAGLLVRPSRTGVPYADVRVLVRLHGDPLGFVPLPLDDGRLSKADLAARLWKALADRILAHARLPKNVQAPEALLPSLPSHDDRCPGEQPIANRPAVTVIVPTAGRPATLARCLDSLRRLSYPDFDVLVVDNRQTDPATRELVREAGRDDDRIRYLPEPAPAARLRATPGSLVAQRSSSRSRTTMSRSSRSGSTGSWSPAPRRCHRPRPTRRAGDTRPAVVRGLRRVWSGVRSAGVRPRHASSRRQGALPVLGRRLRVGQQHGLPQERAPGDRRLRPGARRWKPLEERGRHRGLQPSDPARTAAGLRATLDLLATSTGARRSALRRQLFSYGIGFTAILTKWLPRRPGPLLAALTRGGLTALRGAVVKGAPGVRRRPGLPRELDRLELRGYFLGLPLYLRSLLWSRRRRLADILPATHK